MQEIKDITPDNIALFDQLIEKSGSVCIFTHIRPDGDALGSSLGLYSVLKALGKTCKILLPSDIPATLKFIFTKEERQDVIVAGRVRPGKLATSALETADLLFALDFNDTERIGSLSSLLKESKAKKVLIDHHRNPNTSIFDVVFSEPLMSSTAEYLYHILIASSISRGDSANLPMACCTALFTGMTTDTNNFANSVVPTTMKMAMDLLERGVDRDAILENIYNRYSENRLRLQAHLLGNVMKISQSGISVIVLTSEDLALYPVREGETEGFVNLPLAIDKVKISFFIKQEVDAYRVSIRSKGNVRANVCSQMYFSGGGHFRAAGGKLPIDMTPQEVADYTFEKAEAFLKLKNIE